MRSRYSYAKKNYLKKILEKSKNYKCKKIIKYMKDHEYNNAKNIKTGHNGTNVAFDRIPLLSSALLISWVGSPV